MLAREKQVNEAREQAGDLQKVFRALGQGQGSVNINFMTQRGCDI